MLISLELVFVSISLHFAFFSVFLGDSTAQKYSLLIIAVAAGETAIGCSLLVVSYKLGRKVSYASLKCLKG
jgi:NADH-quinone oxidoreductase subunit K